MTTFHYTAQNQDGRTVDGQAEAATVGEARRLLEQQGLHVIEVTPLAAPETAAAEPNHRLTTAEAHCLAGHLAQLSSAQLPLAAGLRAAADESDSQRLAEALNRLATWLDQGGRLEDAVSATSGLLPRDLCGLLAAAARTGHVGAALSELVEHQQAACSLRRGVWAGLAYPLFVAGLGSVILLFILLYLAGQFKVIFAEFGVRLPWTTELFFWWRDQGLGWSAGGVGLFVISAAVLRWRLNPAGRRRLLARLPIVGPLWHWCAVGEWCSFLSVLTRQQIPLLESLRLSADGLGDAHIRQMSLSLAAGLARGRSLWQMMESVPDWPGALVPLIRWGEETGVLAEAFAVSRELLEERVRMRCVWLQTVLPPALMIAFGSCVLFAVGALFGPMLMLLQALSS